MKHNVTIFTQLCYDGTLVGGCVVGGINPLVVVL